MFGLLRKTIQLAATQPLSGLNKCMHILTLQSQTNYVKLLQPLVPNKILSCGFKVKGRLRRRCKDCYFVRRQERLYIICDTHLRHKQMSMVKKEHNTWMLSHAMQSKVRPY